jgi:dUTP pyrophosphatase
LSIRVPSAEYYARIAPRSGLALKNGIDIGGGICDASFTGIVHIILFNHDDKEFKFEAGDRLAQMIVEKIAIPEIVEVSELPATSRQEGGFGSTGVK